MDSDQMTAREGWGWPINSRKAHYYTAGRRSLCGKWVMLGGHLEQGNDGSADNCAACKRKRAALAATPTPPAGAPTLTREEGA